MTTFRTGYLLDHTPYISTTRCSVAPLLHLRISYFTDCCFATRSRGFLLVYVTNVNYSLFESIDDRILALSVVGKDCPWRVCSR